MYIYNIIYSLKAVACFLSSRTDLLCSPRITAGKAPSLVMHLVSYRGSWKHRLKQNFIFSLVHWKRSLTPRGNTSHAQLYRFFTWPDVRTGLPWKIPLKRAFRDHNSLFCIRGAVMGKILNSPNFFLQTSLSLSYLLHNSMSKELFRKALKCKNKKQEARRKNKLNRKKWKGNLLTVEMGA